MKSTLLLFTFCLCVLTSRSATDTTRIFFIGNSFIFTNDVPGILKGLCDSAGIVMQYGQHTPGGISVGDISQDTLAHWRSSIVFNNLRVGNWDYVVLQDNQGRFIYSTYGSFPSPSVSRVVEGHIKIRDSMKRYNPCANMVLFAGWGPQDGYAPYASTGAGLIRNIYNNYHFLNDSMHEVLSPIGIAWARSWQMDSTVDLWGPDRTHESLEGSYLTAAVLFSTIFRTNPARNTFTGGVDTAVARRFRQIAWSVVNDSAASNRLPAIGIPVSRSGNLLSIPSGFSGLQWYRNDTLISGATTATLIGAGNNCYSVTGVDTNGCPRKSLPYCGAFTPALVQPAAFAASAMSIYPNPTSGIVYCTGLKADATLTVTDAAGRLYLRRQVSNNAAVDIKELEKGIYFFVVTTDGEVTRHAVVIE